MIYQLKIKLLDVKKPPVWRRVLIDADNTFADLHLVIQEAMGWDKYHLYSFGYNAYDRDFYIAIPNPNDWEPPTTNASKAKVYKYLNRENPLMKYVYDFGDDWIHDVVLEKVFEDNEIDQKLPICLEAKGACPPEDCGGPWGYEDLKILATEKNPTDEEMEHLEWYGIYDDFDPKQIDIDLINQRLSTLQKKKRSKRKIDSKKLSERVQLLQKLISGFSRKVLNDNNIADHAYKIIDILVDNEINLASSSPEIWAAAIVIYTQDNLFMNLVKRDDVYNYFGVKASGVQNRIATIDDTIYDNIDANLYEWEDEDDNDEEYYNTEDSNEVLIEDLINAFKAGKIKLPPDFESFLRNQGLL